MVGSIGQGVELNSVWFFVASVVKAGGCLGLGARGWAFRYFNFRGRACDAAVPGDCGPSFLSRSLWNRICLASS